MKDIVKIMGHSRCERTKRFHLLILVQTVHHFFPLCKGYFTVGHIGHDPFENKAPVAFLERLKVAINELERTVEVLYLERRLEFCFVKL